MNAATFRRQFARSLRVLVWSVPLPLLLAAVLPTDTTTFWLQLPHFCCCAGVLAAVLTGWPLLSRARPGQDWLLRCSPGPWRGNGAAIAGAIAAAALALAVCGLVLAWFGPPVPPPRARLELIPDRDTAILRAGEPLLTFAAPAVAVAELHLRPIAMVPGGELLPTQFTVRCGERELDQMPLQVAGGQPLFVVPLPPDAVGGPITLQWRAGTLPLAFPPGTVHALAAAARSTVANWCAASLTWLLPLVLTAGVAVALAAALSLPLSLTICGAVLFATTLGAGVPSAEAFPEVVRGRYWPQQLPLPTAGLWLAAAAAALFCGLPRRRRPA